MVRPPPGGGAERGPGRAGRAGLRDLEAASRQLEERCGELKEAGGAAEERGREAAAEAIRAHRLVDKLTVRAYMLTLVLLPQRSCHRQGAPAHRQAHSVHMLITILHMHRTYAHPNFATRMPPP